VLVCHDPELVAWRPDFSSSGQSDPDWTLVRCRGERLTNAINWLDWERRPVQLVLCEACGIDGCASGGYAHVSRLAGHVLWSPPHIDYEDDFEAQRYAASESIERHGAVAMPVALWEQVRGRFPSLPPADTFPPASRRDLPWRRHPRDEALAAYPDDLDRAFADIETVAAWLASEPDAPVEGELVRLEETDALIQLVFYERFEWPAIARLGDAVAPIFGGELVLLTR